MGAIADALVAYMQPLLDQTDGSEGQLNKAMAVGQLCYNLALMPESGRDQALREMRVNLEMDDDEFDEFRSSVVDPMIQRHQEMFPLMHELDPTALPSLQASPDAAARREAYPGTERYAPCPCNSGKKYKFCCGNKSR